MEERPGQEERVADDEPGSRRRVGMAGDDAEVDEGVAQSSRW